ncbi:glycosyltransferase family 4 protein [Vibrio lentus]|uniref:Glycosyl transferase family 1 n=1 Tax=Vibrio lentus TaxID=136468 RepID=A0A855ILI6_9VIBR|nr:glycosyltransferase family 4 protein [Vibrio lentus]PMJ63209.1 glycosyl transferase family 1 [Vibrio lentus]PMJ90772.1 glycosyl transferase family 1 [Vibrio lentus]PMM53406.1 glycosyl transferase family 1 [Vibrio lentus]PMM55407.1 glycosyl transferase family 1 [Vibrio lentus]PMN41980.1 glycosyl transferase family 1 [Vibrio lentus]
MKILVCASYLHAWNSLRPEAAIFIELARQGHQVTIMTQGESEHVSKLEECGIRVVDGYPKRKICFDTIKKIRHELKTHDYDICYAFNSKTIPNAAFACIGFNVKLVVYRGTTGGLYRHDPSAYLTQLHPRVDGIVCVSEAVRQDVVKRVWKNKDNVVTIYKGHELDWYKVPPTERSEFSLNEDDVVAITAAHVRPSKGISVLLEATKYITAPNFHLILAGSGYEPHFDEMKASPMSERIHYIGHRTDIPSIMCMADFQVQPSISGEGLPRTIVEAMANGTTSVVTTTGGAPELVVDGETGYIVPTGDAKALGEAMDKLAQDKAKCITMSEAAKKRLDESFSSRVTVKKHLEFFDRLLSH